VNIESRTYPIQSKVLNKELLIKICQVLENDHEKEFRRFKEEMKITRPELFEQNIVNLEDYFHGRVSILLYCSDMSTYEYSAVKHLIEGGVLDFKNVVTIKLEYTSHNRDKIEFYVSQIKHRDSYIKVLGSSSEWVNAKFGWLKEIVDHIKPQENFILKYKKLCTIWLSAILSFTTIMTMVFLVGILNGEKIGIGSISYDGWIIISFLSLIPIGIWYMWISDQIEKIWPSVEFEFIPEHYNKAKKSRKLISSIGIGVALPIILLLISEYVL
jgi:hypothetical protein